MIWGASSWIQINAFLNKQSNYQVLWINIDWHEEIPWKARSHCDDNDKILGVFSQIERNFLWIQRIQGIRQITQAGISVKDLLCYQCPCGAEVDCWFLTQEIAGLSTAILYFKILLSLSLNSLNSVKTFRKNSIIYFVVIMKWVLCPIVTATAMEKMGITVTNESTHIALTTSQKNICKQVTMFETLNESENKFSQMQRSMCFTLNEITIQKQTI